MIFAVFDVLLAVNMCINYSFFYNYDVDKHKDDDDVIADSTYVSTALSKPDPGTELRLKTLVRICASIKQ